MRDGQRRTSHSPQAANMKLEILPNRVALPSLVSRMPACQAARSAAKKKAATGDRDGQRAARPVHRLARACARSATGTAAPAPAARTPPRPARPRRGGRGTARPRARHCRPAARRTPSDAPLMGCESPLSVSRHPAAIRRTALCRRCSTRSRWARSRLPNRILMAPLTRGRATQARRCRPRSWAIIMPSAPAPG